MDITLIYIAVSLAILAVVVSVLYFAINIRTEVRFAPRTSIAITFVVAAILFGSNWLMGYALMSIGVVLAIVDAFRRSKKA